MSKVQLLAHYKKRVERESVQLACDAHCSEAVLPMQPGGVSKQERYVVSFQVDPEGEGFKILAAASKVEQMQSQHAQGSVEQAFREVKAVSGGQFGSGQTSVLDVNT